MVEEDRGKQELRVYPQPVHMLAQVRGGPEVVELNEYLEGKVGQRVHYPNVLRPESLPKRLQTRRLQAITGQVPVRETIMRWYRHRGMDLRDRDADSQRIQFEFAEFAANSFAARIRCEFGLKFTVLSCTATTTGSGIVE